MMHKHSASEGFSIVAVLTFMVVFTVISIGVLQMIVTTVGSTARARASETAFQLADAGINYYLWHLNHNNTDLKDGQTWPSSQGVYGYGPYTHTYKDSSGKTIGSFTLWIKPGTVGSTIATVRSIGTSNGVNAVKRTIEARIGAPSFSTYAVAGNTALWFGNTESANGPVHSNVGVKMDGSNSDIVTSAGSTYTVPTWSGNGAGSTKAGVWCDATVTSPVSCTTRNKTSWQYPVTAVDFNKIVADLCQIKKLAINDTSATACNNRPARTAGYIPAISTTFSLTAGYLISLNDNNTYNLEKVTNERDTRSPYSSALTRTVVATNIPVPANNIIFVEDNVWVRTAGPAGFNGRVTIASARLAVSGDTTATIAGPIKYADKYSGANSIGIVAENNIEVAPYVGAPVEINAALIAKSGGVGIRQTYRETGGWVTGYANSNQGLTFFGSLASNQLWTWSVMLCGTATNANCWAGYRYTNTIYDENLRYSPPPYFPVTSTFDIVSWREVLTTP